MIADRRRTGVLLFVLVAGVPQVLTVSPIGSHCRLSKLLRRGLSDLNLAEDRKGKATRSERNLCNLAVRLLA